MRHSGLFERSGLCIQPQRYPRSRLTAAPCCRPRMRSCQPPGSASRQPVCSRRSSTRRPASASPSRCVGAATEWRARRGTRRATDLHICARGPASSAQCLSHSGCSGLAGDGGWGMRTAPTTRPFCAKRKNGSDAPRRQRTHCRDACQRRHRPLAAADRRRQRSGLEGHHATTKKVRGSATAAGTQEELTTCPTGRAAPSPACTSRASPSGTGRPAGRRPRAARSSGCAAP